MNAHPMKRFFLLLIFGLLFLVSRVEAGVAVNFPTKNTIIQRDQNNQGRLQISGTYTISYQKVEARLISLPENVESTGAWVPLATPDRQGIFVGSLVASGGWYRLEIRGMTANNEIDTISVQPVGIGEVFLIAGHSNAMGLPNLGAKSSSDRVVSFNAFNKYLNGDNITVAPDSPMPVPDFDATQSRKPHLSLGRVGLVLG